MPKGKKHKITNLFFSAAMETKGKKKYFFLFPYTSHRLRLFTRVIKNRIIITLSMPDISEEETEKTKEVTCEEFYVRLSTFGKGFFGLKMLGQRNGMI